MIKAATLHKRDQQVREKLGWPGGAFIAPQLPAPTTEHERFIRDLFREHLTNAVTIHVYDVVEMLEKAYEVGVVDGRRGDA